MVAHAKLSANGADAIAHLKTAPGKFSQFVMVIGSGLDQVVEIVQHELSPLMLWTLTTNADERMPVAVCWPIIRIGTKCRYTPGWLSVYPRGLTAVGLREMDETLLEAAA